MEKLRREFYCRDTLEVARDLLGKYLVRRLDGAELVVRVTETEAYIGAVDKACHAYGGRRTARTETLYAKPGTAYVYLIYGMCDETFSINCTAEIPEDCDRGWFYFFVTLLNQLYWVGGATLGGLLGNLITFDTKGLDFVMTAMFIVIFLEQWLKEKHHFSEWAGLASSAACLLIFGKDNFMIPAMICILLLLTAFRKPVGRKAGEEK